MSSQKIEYTELKACLTLTNKTNKLDVRLKLATPLIYESSIQTKIRASIHWGELG